MLTRLYIRNYALVDEIEISFGPGLNILTGETGAGKSILIGALSTILGARADTLVVRPGERKAVVEASFDIANHTALRGHLEAQEIDSDDSEVILRREILDSGRSRAFVNDTPVQLSALEEIGDMLVDLHGQHEHQSLLRPREHVHYLDDFGGHRELLQRVADSHDRLIGLLRKLDELEGRQRDLLARRDLYVFQLEEISRVDPGEDEEEQLLREERILKNSARLSETTQRLYNSFYEEEGSAFERLASAVEELQDLVDIDPEFAQLLEDCRTAQVLVEDVSRALQHYSAKLEFDPERLETIRMRLAAFSGLKKKYGPTLAEVRAHKERIEQELASLENFDNQLESLRQDIDRERADFSAACKELSKARQEAASRLQEELPPLLDALGINGARFEVQIEREQDPKGLAALDGQRLRASRLGVDQVEFFIATNPGAPLRPLSKIASGGEISRVMLALKSLVAASDRIPVLIFDEIDLGISGRIAQAVGRQLRQLSRSHQILCITHLPQIASMGDRHYLVEKVSADSSAQTSVRQLADKERAEAIARLLGGESISETHLRSAEQLLAEASAE
jgi:DNA repair protein RecN (Recombination protein N)